MKDLVKRINRLDKKHRLKIYLQVVVGMILLLEGLIFRYPSLWMAIAFYFVVTGSNLIYLYRKTGGFRKLAYFRDERLKIIEEKSINMALRVVGGLAISVSGFLLGFLAGRNDDKPIVWDTNHIILMTIALTIAFTTILWVLVYSITSMILHRKQ